ncbi:MAG: 16S rRNA (guanine(527)-N(7))-methyltransferase RsmG [Caulobacteraceae bacterium]
MSHEARGRDGSSSLSTLEDRRRLVDQYRDLLERANAHQNLVGRSTLEDFDIRHVLDSAQLLDLAPHARIWVDLGSGGGLPGVILAILLRGTEGAVVHLIESVGRKCAFLEDVVARLSIPAMVHRGRAERLAIAADAVTARACAPTKRLFAYAHPHLALGGLGIFLKGAGLDSELAEARREWRWSGRIEPSRSDPGGRILIVEDLRHAS